MTSEPIERLVLPRLDWYDSEGRINKDALIENFNAIESKINELASVSAFDIAAPDFSTFSFDDVTLSSDDNKIVNLKSFINIMKLKGFPIVCTWEDKVLTKLQYYNDSYRLVTITNVDLSELGTNGKIWVYLDYLEDMVYISDDGTNQNEDILIACYDDGIVHSIGGLGLIDVNILQVCADMTKFMKTYDNISDVGRQAGKKVDEWFSANAFNGNRIIGEVKKETSGLDNYSITFRDFGV